MIVALLLSLSALAAPPTDAPTPSQAAAHRVLAARHFAGCAAVDATTTDPVTDLVAVAERASMPPWAGLRAAECLVSGHAVAARTHLESWVVDPDRAGLARVVLARLDVAPLSVGVPVARQALTGPDPADVRRRLLRLDTPELRAVATEGAP